MFYFLIPSLVSCNFILIASAVIPAVFLMLKVYQSDHLEKEPAAVLWNLTKAGIFASLIAMVEERVLSALLGMVVRDYQLYQILLYFGVVAISEESSKYLMLKRHSWTSPAFDCQYDGVVYAVFVSLGFALWENISYVLSYGFHTALIRAVTAIPGHACFGVFMGVFYGLARKYENRGEKEKAGQYRFLAVIIPVLLHGAYDYIATMQNGNAAFICFVAVLFLLSFVLVGRMARQDRYI